MTQKEQTTHKIITSVLAMQISSNILTDIQSTKVFKNSLKMHINRTIDALKEVEVKHYDNFFNSKETDFSVPSCLITNSTILPSFRSI